MDILELEDINLNDVFQDSSEDSNLDLINDLEGGANSNELEEDDLEFKPKTPPLPDDLEFKPKTPPLPEEDFSRVKINENIEDKRETEIISDLPNMSSGVFKQTQLYLDNMNGDKYLEYLNAIDKYYSESTKKQKKSFNFFVDDKGVLHKKCNESCDKKKDEISIKPPKYIDVKDILKKIKHEKVLIEEKIIELRDHLMNNSDVSKSTEFEKLKKEYSELKDKHQVFSEYLILVNKKDEETQHKHKLLVERAELRNKLRELFEEIKIMNKEGNPAIDEKIKEYLGYNKIKDIEEKLNEIERHDFVFKAIEELPSISKPSVVKKKRVIKRKPKKEEPKEPKKEEPKEPKKEESKKEAPKKRKIIRRKKKDQQGGSIDIDELLDDVEDTKESDSKLVDDLNLLSNFKENNEINLLESIDGNEVSDESVDESVDEPSNESSNELNTKTVKIELTEESDKELSGGSPIKVDELDLSDDLEELESYTDSPSPTQDYSFEKTYESISDDEHDSKIPLEIKSPDKKEVSLNINEQSLNEPSLNEKEQSSNENIQVKVIKLGQ